MNKTKLIEKILGISLGIANSAVAIYEGGHATVIPSAEGPTMAGKMFPSVVAFTKDGQLLVGESAKRQATTNAEGTVFEIQRKMGTDCKVTIFDKDFTPQQISAFILQKIKKDAETYLGSSISKAVITLPAHFNDNQRQATKEAGEIAGFQVMRIIDEPIAACFAYGIDKLGRQMKILVFNFDRFTYSINCLDFCKGFFQVLNTIDSKEWGGNKIDAALVNYFLEEFKHQTDIEVSGDKMAMSRLKEAGEKAKIELSTLMSTHIDLPFLTVDASGPKHFGLTLTRQKLEVLTEPILERIYVSLFKALADAKLSPQTIDKIILVGEATRMPYLFRFFEWVMGKSPERGIDPTECLAIGAAIQAGVVSGEVSDLTLTDVTPLSLGYETPEGMFARLIEKNSALPTKGKCLFTTSTDFQTTISIHLLQGERARANDNVSIGKFALVDLPPAARGVPKIEVTFNIDINGILNVTAKDLTTAKEVKIEKTPSRKLSKEEKERLIEDAE